ncbi:MAG: 3-dehydroquinate synthase [Verrucomicrobiaceae bacterium]|nr:3-dehydroquinate synthase [Verrucomicrobiaceae bacterium]
MPSSAPALQPVFVNLGTRAYTVQVGRNLLPNVGQEIARKLQGSKVAVITDSNVAPLYAETVLGSLRAAGKQPVLITVPAGEASKSMPQAERVLDDIAAAGLDRKSFVVALGGGVIGDLAGFVAAIYQRGIPYVQIPTTVLSQVDSSVGGKTGVNLKDAKNMVGAFHQPAHVFADVETLNSLPKREWNEGFAEIIKHAAIRDASLFEEIEAVADGRGDMTSLIRRNIAIKASIVEQDEFETQGLRALLNFGHTLGHAIEAAAGYGQLLHGEAISIGLHAATWLSTQLSGLNQDEMDRILSALKAFDLPLHMPQGMDEQDVLRRMKMDKKFVEGSIRFVLLRKLGESFVSAETRMEHMTQALDQVRAPSVS